MNSLYPLTYLLFKHGTICHRRISETVKIINYRTFFLGLTIGGYMSLNCFSGSLPVKNLMLIMFILLNSPFQIILFGISQKDVGYEYLYRIYGEYQKNFLIQRFTRYEIISQLFNAILDSFIFNFITLSYDQIILPKIGSTLNLDGY